MEFRWIAVIALWTLLVGPIFDKAPRATPRPTQTVTSVKSPSVPLSSLR